MKKLIFKLILPIICNILSIILIIFIYKLNMIPNKYLYLCIFVLLNINIINIFLFMSKKRLFKIISILLSIMIIITSLFGIFYTDKVNTLLSKAFNNNKIEITGYGVIVLKNSNYNELKDLTNKKIGYLSINDNEYVDLIDIKGELIKYQNVYTLYEDLLNKKIDSMIIDKAYLDLLEDEYSELFNNIKVIHTYSLETKLENTNIISNLDSINIFISGSDARTDTIAERSRSDVNMIMTVNPKTHTILLTSIPRDYYVQLHNRTGLKDKLTHAGIYGVNMSKDTVADLFDIKIDYSIKVCFNSVVEVVDLIGGIDVYSDKTFNSYHIKGWVVPEGMNHFNGREALAYSRERYAYTDGDIHRVQNQQQVLEAIIEKIIKDKTILKRYDQILESFSNLYRTDISEDYIKLIVKDQLTNMSDWTVERQYVTGSGAMLETYSMPGRNLWVMIPNEESMNKAKTKLNEVYNG